MITYAWKHLRCHLVAEIREHQVQQVIAASWAHNALFEATFLTKLKQPSAFRKSARGETEPFLVVNVHVADQNSSHRISGKVLQFFTQRRDGIDLAVTRQAVPKPDKERTHVRVKSVPGSFVRFGSGHVHYAVKYLLSRKK